jgi:hypothetical protein
MKNKTLLIILLALASCETNHSQRLQPQELRVPESKLSRMNSSTRKRAHLVIQFRDQKGDKFHRGMVTLTTMENFSFTLCAGNSDILSAWLPYDKYTISMDPELFSVYDYQIEGLKDPEINKLTFEAVDEIRLIITFIRKKPKPLPTV